MLGMEVMSMDAMQTGQLIAQRRKEKGMTQKELAERLHVTTQAVSKWERGLNYPDIALLEPLAEQLELTVPQLLSGSREEAQPPEELMTESLRTFDGQWRRVLRRWRWLFGLTAGLLIVLVLLGGYWWVQEHTDWLPQHRTVVEPMDTSGLEELVADTVGRSVLLYDVTLADDIRQCYFQMELWGDKGLVESYVCGGLRWDSDEIEPPRCAPLVFSYKLAPDQDPTSLEFGLGFCGVMWRSGALEEIPDRVDGAVVSGLQTEVVLPDWGEGVVLACISIDAGRGGVRPGPTGAGVQPKPEKGEIYLLLRMLCR